MKKSMKRVLFIAFVLLGFVACKEDLSGYYDRLEKREASNELIEKANAEQEAENAKMEAENDDLAARNEERDRWNAEQTLRNAEQALRNAEQDQRNTEQGQRNAEQDQRNAEQSVLNDSMAHVIDSLLKERNLVYDQNVDLGELLGHQVQNNADQAARNGQLRLMWEDLQHKIDSLEKILADRVEPRLLTMEFVKADNQSLKENVKCKIIGDSIIECWLPGLLNEKLLKPRFTYEGTMVVIDGFEAESGKTEIDFTRPRTVAVAVSSKIRYYTIFVHSYTGLPLMFITTDGYKEVTSKEVYLPATMHLREDVKTRAAGDVIESRVNIKGRGNSSWKFPKKPFRLKFDEKISLLDMHKDKSWVLLPNYNDKSMLRNSLAFYMSSISNLDYTPESHFVELIFNNKHWGTYQLCEKVKISNHRVAVGDDGFLLEVDSRAPSEADSRYFAVSHLENVVNIKDPEVAYGDANYNYAKDFVMKADNALFSNNFTDPKTGWQAYMDMDSFVDWYLIHEIGKNLDSNFDTSCYMHFARGGKLMMGPVWDMDVAYGNMNQANQSCYKPTGFHIKLTQWYSRLFRDPAFVKRVKERFNYFYRHQNDILANVNADAQYLKLSAQENNEVWHLFNVMTWPNYNIWGSYQNEVQELKTWFVTRMEWLKTQFDSM